MKHLVPILFLSFIFSGELEVDGDLTVTGNIQNQTIDSLLQVIQDLQSQLSALQGGVSQKVFEFTASSQDILTENELIPGYNVDWATIQIVECSTGECYLQNSMSNPNESQHILRSSDYSIDGVYYYPRQNNSNSFYTDFSTGIIVGFGVEGEHTMKILVTAQFSDSDVQLRKTGLQSKDKKTD